ncbi:unnamed protein product, partial [Adineta steineri]
RCLELDRLVTVKLDTQREKTIEVQSKIAELLREQDVTRNDIDSLTSHIHHLKRELDTIEKIHSRIDTHSIVIPNHLIQIEGLTERKLDLSHLSPVYKTINRSGGNCKVIAINGDFLLMQQGNNLCLIDREMTIIKKSLYFQDSIFDMCWSSILSRFIVIADNGTYLVDENTMAIETLQSIEKRRWFSCTCSDAFLFASTLETEPSIVKFSMSPTVVAIKEWKTPYTCTSGERIDNIVYNNLTLALMISNAHTGTMRMELRSSDTFDLIWTLKLDIAPNKSIATRCCLLNCGEWLVADFNTSCLAQITNDGKIKRKISYGTAPYRIALFGPDLLVSVLEDDILYDIKWQPELTPPLDFLNTYTFTSKRKEGYSCVLPVSQTTDTILPETILFSELEPFFEVIHSQAKTTCTYRLDPYWTYELCHGLQIRQYHETKVGGKRAVVQEYTLGTHHSEDQNRLVNQDNQQLVKIHYKTIENRQVPMLPVRYTHGTACEINSNQPRETLVLYMCHEKGNNAIINFHEVSSCYYEMTIASPQLCQIPAF